MRFSYSYAAVDKISTDSASRGPSEIAQFLAKLEMWANAQRDGRPVQFRWRPLFNAAKFG